MFSAFAFKRSLITGLMLSAVGFSAAASGYTATPLANPDRVEISDANGWVATFTTGARTVSLRGSSRTYTEPSAAQPFTTATWIRVLPEAFDGSFDPADETWLSAAQGDTSPDILETAMSFVEGAASDADYGPLDPVTFKREEGSDFNDYLGISWTYPGKVDAPEADQINSLDCSGYMRMVFGYAGGLPLSLNPDGQSLPRRAYQILESAPGPGIVVTPNAGAQVTDFSRLAAGDLVFFDADDGDGTQIDHVGMYIGLDTNGKHRFISSRKTVNGPTFGTDYSGQGGKSILNGSGFWAKAFRAVSRL
jgi:cell wall-associated NlpC family hydrolase